jgi:hypothetical protein
LVRQDHARRISCRHDLAALRHARIITLMRANDEVSARFPLPRAPPASPVRSR